MANSVMLFNRPDTTWTVDWREFMAAAREKWVGAEIADTPDSGDSHLVGIQYLVPGGPGVDCEFVIDPRGEGYFSIRRGSDRPAAEMFVWVREWLGPKNECSIVNTGAGFPIADVPYGVDVDELLEIIVSVQPQ